MEPHLQDADAVTVTLRLPFDSARSFEVTGASRDASIPAMIQARGGYYEPEVMLVLKQFLEPSHVAFDIGANLGAISFAMSALLPNGRVYAFEPVPENYAYLAKNVARNGVTNIVPVNAGCFSTPTELEFHYVEEFAGGAFVSPVGVTDPRERRSIVKCVTVDGFMEENRIGRLDFIKLDVEGAEDDVMIGARETCAAFHPTLLIEFNPVASEKFFGRSLKSLYERVASYGYDMSLLDRTGKGNHWKISGYEPLIEQINRQDGVGDVVCRPL